MPPMLPANPGVAQTLVMFDGLTPTLLLVMFDGLTPNALNRCYL